MNYNEVGIFNLSNHDKQELIISLCVGLKHTSDFIDNVNLLLNDKSDIFTDLPINLQNLILPIFRRTWVDVYEVIPDILLNKEDALKLYRLLFNLDDFLTYLRDILIKTEKSLSSFDFLDKEVTICKLIAENYIAMILDKAISSKDRIVDIRELKIKNIIKNGL